MAKLQLGKGRELSKSSRISADGTVLDCCWKPFATQFRRKKGGPHKAGLRVSSNNADARVEGRSPT